MTRPTRCQVCCGSGVILRKRLLAFWLVHFGAGFTKPLLASSALAFSSSPCLPWSACLPGDCCGVCLGLPVSLPERRGDRRPRLTRRRRSRVRHGDRRPRLMPRRRSRERRGDRRPRLTPRLRSRELRGGRRRLTPRLRGRRRDCGADGNDDAGRQRSSPSCSRERGDGLRWSSETNGVFIVLVSTFTGVSRSGLGSAFISFFTR